MNTIDKTYSFPVIIGISILLSAFVIAGAYTYKYKDKTRVMVTGKAEKDFVSDLIVWRGDYSRVSMDLKESYASLKADELAMRGFQPRISISICKMMP